jgi:hypothetical protein
MPEIEIPKRLAPTLVTVRHLFAHSGNQCAFDPCDHPLIDEHGNFVAQLCHIEAALPEGERFNPDMTNEDRRQRENLLLMCHRHHVETDDVGRFPVEKMREIKQAHEAKFAAVPAPVSDAQLEEAVQAIVASSIVDRTNEVVLRLPQTFERFAQVSGVADPHDREEQIQTALWIRPLLEKLKRLPVDTRGVLLVIVDRGEDFQEDIGLPLHELEHATQTDIETLRLHVATLDRYGIAGLFEDWGEHQSLWWVVTNGYDGWGFWRSVKEFCDATETPLEVLVMDLRFDLLDGEPTD